MGVNDRGRSGPLNRRTDWTGEVLYVTPEMSRAHGYDTGYYQITGYTWASADEFWPNWEWIGREQPEGVPVFIWRPDTHDYKAVPATVWCWRWVAYAVALTAGWTVFSATIYEGGLDDGWFHWFGITTIIWLSVLWQWFYAIEPVRATKVAGVLVAIFAVLKSEQNESRQEYRQYSRQAGQDYQRMLADPWGQQGANPVQRPSGTPQHWWETIDQGKAPHLNGRGGNWWQ